MPMKADTAGGATDYQSWPETNRGLTLTQIFVRNCRRTLWQTKFADSTGRRVTGGALLAGSLALARLLRRSLLASGESMVGILMPPSVGAVMANTALALGRRTSVNLNYTLPQQGLDACIRQCQLQTVISTRPVMERLNLKISVRLIYLEDLIGALSWGDKCLAACGAYVVPGRLVERMLKIDSARVDDLLTVCFTSGSTGEPKGVMLSHCNVASNLEATCRVLQLRRDDVALGLMPFFHAYGFTFSLWAGLALEQLVVLEHNPLDGHGVGTLCRQFGVTIMMATPTFLRIYLRRCEPADLSTLQVVAAGAERLSPDLARRFTDKFGVGVIEAYGTTELSPLVAVNLAQRRADGKAQAGKEGSVGRPLPGVTARIVGLENGLDVPPGQQGMLLVKGPNVTQGYLGRPELTAKVIRDGWYETGDIASIDAQGFLTIADRQSRFSKIGGEMVPHLAIEEALARVLETGDEFKAVVIALADEKKGERIFVMHEPVQKSPEEIVTELARAGLPNLWVPTPASFIQVPQIPLLGTGKPDLKQLKSFAAERRRSLPTTS